MNEPSSSPRSPQQPASRRRSRPRRSEPKHQELLLETTLKLTCNLVLTGGATFALLQLWPYHQSQQTQLQQVQTAVQKAQLRTQQLRADFTRYFDPSQASSIMQEQSGRANPQQRPVIWVEPAEEE